MSNGRVKRSENTKNKKRRRIVFIGSENTGKSSLINRFVNDRFFNGMDDTIGASCTIYNYSINDVELLLELIDTSGANRFKRFVREYYTNAHYVIAIFDLTNLSSLLSINDEISFVRSKCPHLPIILIGTKLDLKSNIIVQESIINSVISRHNIDKYYRISAKSPVIGNDIKIIFSAIARDLAATEEINDTLLSPDYIIKKIDEGINRIRTSKSFTYNEQILVNAVEKVRYLGLALLAKIKYTNSNEVGFLQGTLRKVYAVLAKPTSLSAIQDLERDVETKAPGHSILWKKFVGAVLIFVGAAVIGISAFGIPFTGGISGIGIAGGCVSVATGILFFRAGLQKKIAKEACMVTKVARSNFIANDN